MKTIGILGGMGPEATAKLYSRIIRKFQNNGAKYDSDFPQIYINSIPLPDVVESVKSKEKIISMLVEEVKKLESFGADFIAIPCNSVFSYYNQMQDSLSIPIINIMEEASEEIKKKGYKKIGILGTKLTIKQRLFDFFLDNIKIINPTKEQQKEITKIIMNILSGNKTIEDKLKLKLIINDLKNSGAEAVVLGCTELPLILSQKDFDIELFDTIEIIAKAVLKKAGFKRWGCRKMTDKIQKLREYTIKLWCDGFVCGVNFSTIVAAVVDISDRKFDHPYLIGITYAASLGIGLYNRNRYRRRLNDLEEELLKG